ncbi:hypothetical protein W2_gp056 [Caulobacter phage W2]|uniref:Uncharacterized protein n=1 Tax=Caulobacter phage TMCBR4 TaxID=3028191 RepID=A0AAE9ZLF1_9CAUD|nr:hypothetical protein TMCBR4_gp057 [Caulobacter phage TMCBR4]WDS38424.1 hypothetical protein W2_gp056 [Caulobacter phage W2]
MTDTGDLFGFEPPPPEPAQPVQRKVDDVVTYRGGGRKREEKPPAPLVTVDPYPCMVAGCGAHGSYGKNSLRWCYTHRPADYWTM